MAGNKLLIAHKGSDADLGAVTVETLAINGAAILATSILLGVGEVVDINGEADALIMDALQNVRMDGSSAGKLRFKIAGAYDVELLANILRMLSGTVLETNTINETTAASGVTIDGVLIKDGGAIFADAAAIDIDTINEATAAAGVTADGVLLKDGGSNGRRVSQALTATDAITVGRHGVVTLAHATVVIAATLAAPTAGDDLIIYNTSASGTVAHTVTVPGGVTFDGTNTIATLNAPGEALHIVAASATRWLIMENIGAVGLS